MFNLKRKYQKAYMSNWSDITYQNYLTIINIKTLLS